MNRYVMTAKRKAALRKAQLASAKKRRGLSKTGRKNFRKAVRNHPVKTAALFGTAITVGGVTGWKTGNVITGRGMLSRNARQSQPHAPGMRALPYRQRAIAGPRRPGRSSKVNQNRTKDALNPYYQSRYDRGQSILRRANRQAPPLRRSSTTFSTDLNGITRVKPRRTVALVSSSYRPGAMGYPRTKRQQKIYLSKKAGTYRPNQVQY